MSSVPKMERASSRAWLPIVLLAVGLAAIAAAACLWLMAPGKPASVEGDLRPVAFSLGLDDEDVVRIDRTGAGAFWRGADRILPNGFAPGVARIWKDLERNAPDPTLAPVKVIPSGGMYPYYRSTSYAGEIQSFVRKGGSLICFGQPLGAMYSVLPGAPRGVGWVEVTAEAREAKGTVEVQSDHPALATLSLSEFNAHFAGFFTRLPEVEGVSVLLRDQETGRPVVLAYRYGRGLVLATTLVSDAAVLGKALDKPEKELLQSMLAWAFTGDADIMQFNPGDRIEMTYPLRAGKGEAADGYVQIYRPDGQPGDSFALPLPAEGEDGTTQPLGINGPRGIWRIVSYPRDADGQPAGPSVNTWFAVGHAPVKPPISGLHASITVPGTQMVIGSVVPITVYLWNDDAAEMEITYRGPVKKRTVKLAPGASKLFVEEIALDKPEIMAIKYEFYGAAGGKLLEVRRRLVAGEPDRVFLSLTGPPQAAGGRIIPVELAALSVTPGKYTADCWVRLVHNGSILWQETRRLDLNGAYSTKATPRLEVPLPAEHGRYVLEASLAHGGKDLARTWLVLNVP